MLYVAMEPLFYYDRWSKAVLCRQCQTGIVVRNKIAGLTHFRKPPHHLKGARLQLLKEQLAALDLADTGENDHPSPQEQPISAIPHLRIHDALECKDCPGWFSINKKNARAHRSQEHGTRAGRKYEGLEQCQVQTLFAEKESIRYFKVAPLEASPPPHREPGLHQDDVSPADVEHFISSQMTILDEAEAAEKAQAATVHAFNGHQSAIIPWVRACGFDRLLDGFSNKDVHRCHRQPQEDEMDAELVRDVATAAKELLEETWSWCVDGPHCRLTRPMAVMLSQFWTEATIHSRGFRPGLSAASRVQYFNLWAEAIFVFWRVTAGQLLVASERRPGQEGRVGPGRQPHAPHSRNSDADDSDDNLSTTSASAEPLLFTGTDDQRAAFSCCLKAAAEEDQERLRRQVTAFSLSLIEQNLPRDRFQSPLLAYCAMIAVHNSHHNGWREPGNFNSSLSGLIYCAQLWTLRRTCEVVDQDPSHLADDVLADYCGRWLRQERSTTFGIVLNWRLMLFDVAKKQVSSKTATWSLDGSEVSYQGTTIRMEHIGQLYRRTLARARLIRERDLLLGADHLSRPTVAVLREGEHRHETGWWFGLDERNHAILDARGQQLLEHIKTTPTIRAQFLLDGDQWRPAAVHLYRHHVQEWLECMFVLFQILAPPLRGPELTSVTIWNTEKLRSVLLRYSRVMFYTTYHKGQAQWGSYKDNIRFATGGVSDEMILFMIQVVPLLRIFEWQDGRRLSPYLWSKNGRVWREGMLTPIMRKICALAEVPEMCTSHWRQISASILKMKFGADRPLFESVSENVEPGDSPENDGEEEDVATLAQMSNHSVHTHHFAYANETSLVAANVWDGLIKRAHRASTLWANFFGFDTPGDTDESAGRRKRPRESDDDGRGMLKSICLSIPRVRRHWTGHALLQEARKLFGNPRLQWRCIEQEQAVCAATSGAMEVSVVMATGMGKTMVYQLPCSLPDARITVLVLPLVAPRIDLIRRCRELGIRCEEWSPDRHPRASLVLMSAEVASSDEGRQYLWQLYHAEELDRIVFDEWHLGLTALHFRRVMAQLPLLRSIPVPFISLTATLPPQLQPALYRQFHMSKVLEIRASTRRANIGYHIRRLPTVEEDLLESTVIFLQQWWEEHRPSLSASDRAAIFTRSKDEADQLASALGCERYHADVGEAEHKGQILRRWMSKGSSPFLVGSSALGVGLDYPHVRLVVHMGRPYGLTDYAQESGRAGRDGAVAEAHIILPYRWHASAPAIVGGDEATLDGMLCSASCIRAAIAGYMDEDIHHGHCGPNEKSCGRCSVDKAVAASSSVRSEAPGSRRTQPPTPVSVDGPSLLLRRAREDQVALIGYRHALEALRDTCILCRLGGQEEWGHAFGACREVHRWEFINAKRDVLQRTRRRWIRPYDACYHCYQPQNICGRASGAKQCEYGDLVMQSVLGVYRQEEASQWLRREFGVQFSSLEDCLVWAGRSGQMGGARCVNGVLVLARVATRLAV